MNNEKNNEAENQRFMSDYNDSSRNLRQAAEEWKAEKPHKRYVLLLAGEVVESAEGGLSVVGEVLSLGQSALIRHALVAAVSSDLPASNVIRDALAELIDGKRIQVEASRTNIATNGSKGDD